MTEPAPKLKPGDRCYWKGNPVRIDFFYASGISPWAPKDMARVTFESPAGATDCLPIDELTRERENKR